MPKRWYVVQAYSGFEKNVQKILKERIIREQMTDYFGQILVPVEEVADIRNGRRTITERKFYPGYILIEMEMTDSSWHLVKSTPRVNGFIGGTANRPLPISQQEVDSILLQMGIGENIKEKKPRPRIIFNIGQQVRINEGPFVNLDGIVQVVDYDRNKLRVMVQIFGRDTPVELDFNQVEKNI